MSEPIEALRHIPQVPGGLPNQRMRIVPGGASSIGAAANALLDGHDRRLAELTSLDAIRNAVDRILSRYKRDLFRP